MHAHTTDVNTVKPVVRDLPSSETTSHENRNLDAPMVFLTYLTSETILSCETKGHYFVATYPNTQMRIHVTDIPIIPVVQNNTQYIPKYTYAHTCVTDIPKYTCAHVIVIPVIPVVHSICHLSLNIDNCIVYFKHRRHRNYNIKIIKLLQ